MKTFTIENETNNIMIHASAEAAGAVPDAEQFSSEKVLAKIAAEWPAARLIEIWNSLPGVTPVSKFKDRNTAVARIWKAIQTLGAEAPVGEDGGLTAPESESFPPPDSSVLSTDTSTNIAPQGAHVAPDESPASDIATVSTDAPVAPAAVDKDFCTELLGIAARAQTAYWDTLRNVENAIGFELGDPGDLKEVTVALLIEQHDARRKPRTVNRATRENSKTAQVIAMLKREGGATLDEIMTAMGWQKHTTRAMLSAGGSLVKNHGLVITSAQDGSVRRYSIKA